MAFFVAYNAIAVTRRISMPLYLVLNGVVGSLWIAAFEIVWVPGASSMVAGLLYVVFSIVVEIVFRVIAERKLALEEGHRASSVRDRLRRPVVLAPLPRVGTYLGQAAWNLAVNALVLYGFGRLGGSKVSPLFILAFPFVIGNALLRPLLVEQNPLGYWPGRGFFRPAGS